MTARDEKIRIFAGSSGEIFAERMCAYLGINRCATQTRVFSEGNTYVKIGEHVRGEHVYLVQPIGLQANDDFVELLFWMDAFKRSGASYVTAIIPYFSYAKGDKKDEPRVSIRARVCAESIELAGADRVITQDLHAAQIQGFFKKPVDHLFARPLLAGYIKTMMPDGGVFVAPDAGFAKTARKYAGQLGFDVAIGDKARTGHDEQAKVLELIGDVNGKDAVIGDDFSISGGTLVEVAELLKRRGARRIFAVLSHLPISRKGVARIEASPIEKVVTTDSLVNPRIAGARKFRILSIAPLFAEVVRRMESRQSISPLFEAIPEEILAASRSLGS